MKVRSIFAIPLLLLLGTGPTGDRAGTITPESCDTPLVWRIAQLDEEFGLTHEEAAQAVRAAGVLWEEPVGRLLFREDPDEGFPIRFVSDGRHAAIRERRERERELDAEMARIEEIRSGLSELREVLARNRAEHRRKASEFEARQEAHRELVAYWNERGGAPPDVMRELRRAAEELERERGEVNARGEALNALVEEVNEGTTRANQAVEAYNREREALEEDLPPDAVRSGHYRESRRSLGPWVISREREIRIHQFDDRDHLHLVLAHELGHALGLEHSGEPDAVMFVNADRRGVGPEGVRLHPSDVERLLDRCGG